MERPAVERIAPLKPSIEIRNRGRKRAAVSAVTSLSQLAENADAADLTVADNEFRAFPGG